jgi:hypothetical protein
VFSGGWEIPFAHLFPKVPLLLTSGWNLYPILTAQSGFPVDVTGGYYPDGVTPGPAGDGDLNLIRPNWNGGPTRGSLLTRPGHSQ